jgi:hypothetical protein
MVGATVAIRRVKSEPGIQKKSATTSTIRHTQQSTVPSISKRGGKNIMKKIVPIMALLLLLMVGCNGEKEGNSENVEEWDFIESVELDSDSVALLYPQL